MVKKFFKIVGITLLVVVAIFAALLYMVDRNNENEKREMVKQVYEWPESKMSNMLPKPVSKHGEIIQEDAEGFEIDIYGTKSEYNSYVKKCKDKGFTVGLQLYDDRYSARNVSGYSLTVDYWEESMTEPEYYTISIERPE